MQDQAPGLFAKMKKAGTLDNYLDEMDQELGQTIVSAVAQAKMKADKAGKSHLETVGLMNQTQSQMMEAAISELEFPGMRPETTGSALTT